MGGEKKDGKSVDTKKARVEKEQSNGKGRSNISYGTDTGDLSRLDETV